MQRDSDRQGEEDAWRAIVENYGDRAELEDDPVVAELPVTDEMDDLTAPEAPIAPPVQPQPPHAADEDRFVPPPPPPLPKPARDRLAAWVGLFGSPAVLLVCLVAGITLPGTVAYLLVAGFVGGFVYLVVKMPRGPADPWDDGARL